MQPYVFLTSVFVKKKKRKILKDVSDIQLYHFVVSINIM